MYSQANTAGMKSALLIALMAACFTLPSIVHAQAPPGGGDGGMPTFEAPRASEGTVTAGEINSSNTGVILNVPVPDDAVYEGGSLQPEVSQDDGLTFFSVGTPHTITNAELGTAFDLAAISISSIESALGNVLSDGMTLTFREVTTDSEGTVHDAVALGQLLVNMPQRRHVLARFRRHFRGRCNDGDMQRIRRGRKCRDRVAVHRSRRRYSCRVTGCGDIHECTERDTLCRRLALYPLHDRRFDSDVRGKYILECDKRRLVGNRQSALMLRRGRCNGIVFCRVV